MADQLKKLLYNKSFIDGGDEGPLAEWKIAPWKVFGLFIALSILAILVYAYFFTENPQNTLGNIMFYAIILVLAVIVLWLGGNKAWSFKNRIAYFMLTFIILWVMYFALSLVFGYLGFKFYIGGYALWTILTVLAWWSSGTLFDKEINRKDAFFILIVFLVFVGANIPMNSAGGFLQNFDNLINTLLSLSPK